MNAAKGYGRFLGKKTQRLKLTYVRPSGHMDSFPPNVAIWELSSGYTDKEALIPIFLIIEKSDDAIEWLQRAEETFLTLSSGVNAREPEGWPYWWERTKNKDILTQQSEKGSGEAVCTACWESIKE